MSNKQPKIPIWKKYLSHLVPFTIEVTEGTHNHYLEVLYSRGRYQLNTENAIYSFEDLYINYYQAFEALKIQDRAIKNVLILGFGLGSIPVMLERNFKQHYHFTGVELDEEVLILANKYGISGLSSPIELICADAIQFTRQCSRTFDMICMDVFKDAKVPLAFETLDFLEDLKSLIAPNGLLLYNRMAHNEVQKAANQQFFEQRFATVFPEGRSLELGSNWMLVNK